MFATLFKRSPEGTMIQQSDAMYIDNGLVNQLEPPTLSEYEEMEGWDCFYQFSEYSPRQLALIN